MRVTSGAAECDLYRMMKLPEGCVARDGEYALDNGVFGPQQRYQKEIFIGLAVLNGRWLRVLGCAVRVICGRLWSVSILLCEGIVSGGS